MRDEYISFVFAKLGQSVTIVTQFRNKKSSFLFSQFLPSLPRSDHSNESSPIRFSNSRGLRWLGGPIIASR